ncbi:hypothetical protein BT69DRAFT_1353816 [Atractiella rhizophila]|nr:hypothetical protein BT69DRAFT_1353816 [Atractiella rhizophila]
MVALRFLSLAFVGIASVSAIFEPLAPVDPQVPSVSVNTPSIHRSFDAGVLARRAARMGPNAFYTSSYNKELSSYANGLRDIQTRADAIYNSVKSHAAKHGRQVPVHADVNAKVVVHVNELLKQLELLLKKALKEVKHIPNCPHPSNQPGNPPSVPGCGGQLSDIIYIHIGIIVEIEKLAKISADIEVLLKSCLEDLDISIVALINASVDLLPGLDGYTERYTDGFSQKLKNIGLIETVKRLGH